MLSSWQTETGHLGCRWSFSRDQVQVRPLWMGEGSEMQGAHLPPVPDFASHSPFGGPSWFGLPAYDESE